MNTSDSRNRGRKNTKRQNPKALFFICLALALGCFGALVIAFTVVAGSVNKSGYTQTHGLARSGTVTSVTNHQVKVPYAEMGVRLGKPVNGQATTTAHVPSRTSLKPGAAVRVRVDPKDPGYAEFPGQRFDQNSGRWSTVVLLVPPALFVCMAAWWGRVWYRQHKRGQMAEFQGATQG